MTEIPERVFGGNHTNAYMLFYRRWEPLRKDKVSDAAIPDSVKKIIEEHKKLWVDQQNHKLEQS